MHHTQIHLTNNCNLKCLHCYQDSYSNPVMGIDNYKLLINELKTNGVSSISLTGGEPFTIKNFKDYLDLSVNNFDSIAILTNGLLINDNICEYLINASKKVKIFVQVSLEGPKKINDLIRGEGTFDKITKSIDFMKSKGVPFVVVSCTIAPYNYNRLDELYFYLNDNTKADCIWFDRLIPMKQEDYISIDQFKTVLNQLRSIETLYDSNITRVKIRRIRALQFLATKENTCYKCAAGVGTITVMPNMDIMLCRRLNFPVGNLLDKSLSEILISSKDLINQVHSVPNDCKSCKYAEKCNGGLKCLTYNKYHDFNHKDINCFIN